MLVVVILLGVLHVHRIIAMNSGMLLLGAAQVGFARGFRAHGEGRDLLLQASALALRAGGRRLEHQRFELLPAVQAMKVEYRHRVLYSTRARLARGGS